MKMKTAYKVLF